MIDCADRWFAARGWTPFPFQRACWSAQLDGQSGLIHAPTGMGKTYAVWLGALLEWQAQVDLGAVEDRPGAKVIWLTPLRALAGDTLEALRMPLASFGVKWEVQGRTGDSTASLKAKQRRLLPDALVTTPESLTILLSYPESRDLFRQVRCVVVDEWHELLSTKRGVQTELALARLRSLSPNMRTWGLSATLQNIEQATSVLLGTNATAERTRIIRGLIPRHVEIQTIIPEEVETYPWSGHLGIRLIDRVLEVIDQASTTLVFTNTRSQAEIWFRELLRRRPDLIGQIGLHHGSLDREIRQEVEQLLRGDGPGSSALRCVVCTSSLDLGVDFAPVDQVVQIGSPKGIARFLQRAGRSGHRPESPSRIVCVPTNALELIEFAAARAALAGAEMECRIPLRKPMDVLVQHLVTVALSRGFDEHALREEVRSTHAYQSMNDEEWQWAMDFVSRGGPALNAYPRFARIERDGNQWNVPSRQIATWHRMGIGTIVADAAVRVQFANGRSLGTIEESFLARLRQGETFCFAGRFLQLEKLHQMTAIVRRAPRTRGGVPRWNGGKMPLSSQLAEAVIGLIEQFDLDPDGDANPEMRAITPLLRRQRAHSKLPGRAHLLIEHWQSRDGRHWFLYPFAGRLAHEGLGALLSLRMSRRCPISVRATVNDYGIELFTENPLEMTASRWSELFAEDRLLDDLLEAVNATELARRQFREISRVAGLTHQGYPGQASPTKQLQASSEMFYDVFVQFDPSNQLLHQATREVLEQQLEIERIRTSLSRIRSQQLAQIDIDRLTPMSFPLWAESLRATYVSSEQWEQRVRRMSLELAGTAVTVRKHVNVGIA